MEVIPSTARGSGSVPLHQHNVEEWSRLDSLTGMLEHARVETGHWTANTSTSSQKYGKVVDSRARNLADGSMQQRQRKQLEVFQAQVPGGSLQVIRTQSMTSTSSSSSSWRSTLHSNANVASDFENIQLSVKPLDLSTQKTKASVGRSGSHGRRRPPSRPCSIISKVDTDICERNLPPNAEKEDVDQRLSEVSRICRKIHEESKNNTSNSLLFPLSQSSFSSPVLSDNTMIKPDNINRRDFIDINRHSCTKLDKQNSLSILDTLSDSAKKAEETVSNRSGHAIITRNKSCSVEDIQNNNHSERDRLSEGTEMSTDLARTAGFRRSLQLPNRGNNIYFPNGNVSKFCQEFQDGKALDVIKNNTTGLEALENIFRYDSGSERNTSLLFGKNNQAPKFNLVTDNSGNGYELLKSGIFDPIKVSSCKRHSFVTVESLKEVRGRLRHLGTGTPSLDGFQRADNTKCQTRHVEDSDDGIVVEDFSKSLPGINPGLAEQVSSSHVKSYVYGMEAMANCQSDINKSAGTGSLESRTCNRSSSSGGSRSEEWYSRRKSYGFEQVHKPQADNHSEPVTFQEKTSVESSTDSGICRSSETVTTPSWAPFDREKNANGLSTYGNLNVNSSIKEKQHSNNGIMTQTENRGTEISSQSGGRTVVTFRSDNKGNKQDLYGGGNIMENSSIIVQNGWVSGCDSRTTNIMMSNTNAKNFRRFSEPVTVTIPIVHDNSFNNINGNGIMDAKKLHLKQFSEGSSLSIENEWSSGTSLRSRNDSSQKGLANVSKTFAARRQLFQKHSGGNVWSPASKQSDNQVKRHSIAVDESKYVKEDLKSYNLYDKRMEHINFENVFRTNSTCIPHLENSTGLSPSNNKYVVPLQKELEFRIPTATGMSQDASDFQSSSFTFENGDDDDDELFLQNQLAGKKHKKVEFCKTEVHFAAEPGRFNIVETDEKPPPNNIRRRRRSSCVVSSAPQVQDGKTSLPETRFGDSPYEMKLLGGTEPNNSPCQIDVSADGCNKSDLNNPVHIMPASSFPSEVQDDADNIFVQGNATVLSSGRQDTMEIEVHSNEKDVCNDSIILQPNPMISTSPKPRSILKNSKSPRLFHLGETDEDILISGINGKSETLNGSPETKWGVRLKPIHNQDLQLSTTSTWKSRVTLTNPKLDDQKQQNYSPSSTLKDGKLQFLHSSVEGTEFRKQPKSFQLPFQKMSADVSVTPMLSNTQSPESGGNGMEVKIFTAPTWSVAERVRQVEDMKRASLEASGYSTKVNLVSGKTTVMDSRSSDEQQKQSIPLLPRYQQNSHQKSVCLHIDKHKEEAMHRCDMRSQTASDKGLVVRICKNNGSNAVDGQASPDCNMKIKNSSPASDISSSNVKKTTTILIDLSAVPSHNHVTKTGFLKNEMLKKSENKESDKSTATLWSPSLIKSINISSQIYNPEDNKQDSSHRYMQAERQMNTSCTNSQIGTLFAAPRTKNMNIQSRNSTNKYRSDLYKKNAGNSTNNVLLTKKTCVNREAEEEDTKEEMLVVRNQLAVLKELYSSADLSDDSELADEEVRSYMSGGGVEDDRIEDVDSCSMVSGSWRRMRPFRNIQHHFHRFSTELKDPADGSSMLKQEFTSQKPVKKDNLQSHNSDLQSKETLISSRSVQPKITSISLQYEEEKSTEQPPHVCDTNSDCDRYQTSFHSLLSPKKDNLQMNELECPTDFEVNASSTTVSSTSCNKPLFTLQNCNTNSSKSLFTQKHKSLLTSVASHIEPERHTLHFTHDEINYKNLNPTQKRSTNDNFGTDHTISPLGKKVLHPEIEDKFALYHNHNKHDYFSKCSSKQESDPMVLSNSMSLHSVLNKTTSKDQPKKQFHASFSKQYTPSVTSISSDLISNRSNSSESTNKERIKVKEEETKKDGHFKVKTSDEKHKHLDRTFKHESEEETRISDHYHERDSMASRVKSTNYLSTKYDSSHGKIHSGKEVVMSPVYENMKMSDVEPITKSSSQNFTNEGETESDILEELTQAADQILQAVVGYTDEESCRASSDDPDDEIVQCSRRRRGSRCGKVQKPLVSLGTITETPLSKKQQETRNRTSDLRSHKSIGSARKSQQIKKTHHQPTSSTSSLESFTREISQVQKRALLKQEGSGSVDNYSKRKVASSSTSSMPIKSGSRTTRLFQRANSREHLLQTYTSSSEDVASGVKGENNRKPLVPRCTRSHNSFNNRSDPVKSDLRKSTVSPDTQPTLSAKVRARKRDPESTKPKERLPGPSNRMLPLVRKSDGCVSAKPSGGKLHTFRSREDRHQRGSSRLTVKRENTDLVHRVQGGGMTTLEPGIHDKSKRTVIHERRVMGSAGGIGPSSASCVVPHVYSISASSVNHHDNSRTKKNLGLASSQNKELIQRKATK